MVVVVVFLVVVIRQDKILPKKTANHKILSTKFISQETRTVIKAKLLFDTLTAKKKNKIRRVKNRSNAVKKIQIQPLL